MLNKLQLWQHRLKGYSRNGATTWRGARNSGTWLVWLAVGLLSGAPKVSAQVAAPSAPAIANVTAASIQTQLPGLPDGANSFKLQRALDTTSTSAAPPAAGVLAWYKANAIENLAGGAAVGAWADTSGNANHLSQGNVTQQPSYVLNGISGWPAVHFNGSNFLAATSRILPLSNFTLFVVANTSPTNSGRLFGFENSSDGSQGFALYGTNQNQFVIRQNGANNDVILNTTPATGTPNLYSIGIGATGTSAYLNGIASGTGGGTGFSDGGVMAHLGSSGLGDLNYTGDIAEFIIYNSVLSTADRQTVEKYLARKYGLRSSAPPPDGLAWTTVATNLSASATYSDTGLTPDTNYWYRALAVADGGDTPGAALNVTTRPATPSAPAAPTFTAVAGTYLTVTAPALPNGANYFKLQQKLQADPDTAYLDIASSVGTNATTPVAGLTAQTTYTFRFIGIGDGGATAGQAADISTVANDPPNPPSAPLTQSVTPTTVTLQVPAMPQNATRLDIQRAVDTGAITPPANGVLAWFKADAISGLTNGASIATWSDASGNGNDATQSNAWQQPTWQTGAINGWPTVHLDGNDDFLAFPQQTTIRSVFAVVRHATGAQDWAPLLGSQSVYYVHGGQGSNLFSIYTSAPILNGAAYVNGASAAPLTILKPTAFQVISLVTTDNITADTISQDRNFGGRFWNGDYAEVLLYNRPLSDGERQTVERYLCHKYGIAAASGAPANLSWTTVATDQAALSSFTDTGLTPDTQYWYRCVASGLGGSTPGNAGTAGTAGTLPPAPNAPGAPTFSYVGATKLTVTAPALPANALTLKLQQKPQNALDSAYTDVADGLGSGAITKPSGLTAQTTYTFRYIAENGPSVTSGTAADVTTGANDLPNEPDAPAAPTAQQATSATVLLQMPALPARADTLTLQRASQLVPVTEVPGGGLLTWLRGDGITGAGSGAPIAVWPDATGRYNATQNSAPAQPAWIAGALNGYPTLRFDGLADFLSLRPGLDDWTNGLSAFVVTKPTSYGSWARFYDFGNGPDNNDVFLARNGTSSNLIDDIVTRPYVGAYAIGNNAIANDAYQVLGLVQQGGAAGSGANADLSQNGLLTGSSTAMVPAVVTRNNNYIGKSNYPTDAMFQGDIAEVLLYNRALASGEAQAVSSYLARKYSLRASNAPPPNLVWTTVATSLAGNASYTDSSVSSDSNYWYRCVAVGAGGIVPGTAAPVTTPPVTPDAPGMPTLSNQGQASLTATAPTMPAHASMLCLQKKLSTEDDGGYQTIATNPTGNVATNIDTLEPGRTYTLRYLAAGRGGSTPGPSIDVTMSPVVSAGTGTGLQGDYFDSLDFSNFMLSRIDPQVNFAAAPLPPNPDIANGSYAVRWTGSVQPLHSETYNFYITCADDARLWVDGQLLFSTARGVGNGQIALIGGQKYDIKVEYWSTARDGNIKLEWASPNQAREIIPQSQLYPPPVPPGSGTGLTGQYFSDEALTDFVLTRLDPMINFNWVSGSPDDALYYDHFGVRWTGQIQPLYSETYTFYANADDGARVWVNGQLIIDGWNTAGESSGTIALQADQKYDIKVEYHEIAGYASMKLEWASSSQSREIVPRNRLYPNSVSPAPTGTGTGLTGEYFQKQDFDLSNRALVRLDPTVDFSWNNGRPAPSISSNFVTRWTGQVQPLYSETYSFIVRADDRARLTVNGQMLVDDWHLDNIDVGAATHSGTITLQAGQQYDIKLEYAEFSHAAQVHLWWASPSQEKEIIPASQLYPGIAPSIGTGTGLRGSYYENSHHYEVDFGPGPFTAHWVDHPQAGGVLCSSRIDPKVDFSWGAFGPPAQDTPSSFYSVFWTGSVEPLYSEDYTFYVDTGTGSSQSAQLWLNDSLLIDSGVTNQGTIHLTAGQLYSLRLVYVKNNLLDDAAIHLSWASSSQTKEIIPSRQLYPSAPPTNATGTGTGLVGQYFDNEDFTNGRFEQTDAQVNFNWTGGSPGGGITPTSFSVRWNGEVQPRYTEQYAFYVNTDGGTRLWVDDQLIINSWGATGLKMGQIALLAGRHYHIMVEYYNHNSTPAVQLLWSSPSQAKEVIPQNQLYPDYSAAPAPIYDACQSSDANNPCPPIPARDDGVFLSQNVPTHMLPGATYQVEIDMANTGTKSWAQEKSPDDQDIAVGDDTHIHGANFPYDLYCLNGGTWGTRGVAMPNLVRPNGEAIFAFTVTAPTTTGVYNFQWQMEWQLEEAFGQPSPNIMITVGPPDTLGAPILQQAAASSITLQTPLLPVNANGLTLQRAVGAPTIITPPPSAGLRAWFKADAITDVTDGAAVSTWSDASGSGNDANQTNLDQQPVFAENAVAGHPALRFDGVDDFMPFPTISDIHTAFMVLRHAPTGWSDYEATLGSLTAYDFHGGAGQGLFLPGCTAANGTVYMNGIGMAPEAMTRPTTFSIVTVATTDAAQADAITRDRTFGRYWHGDYAEILLYNTVLSDSNRQAVERYLGRKYGIGVAGDAPPGLTWTTVATGLAGGATYTDNGVSPNTNYWYRCVTEGLDTPLTGPAINVVSGSSQLPGAPDAPTFSNITATGVRVTTPNLPADAISLRLQRKLPDEPETAYRDVTADITPGGPADVTGLNPVTAYTFRYVADNDAGSTPGTPADVTTLDLPPDAPGVPQFSDVGQTSLTATLPDLPIRATTLTLQQKLATDGDQAYVDVATGLDGGATQLVTGLVGSTDYTFRCVAVGPGGSTPGAAAGITSGTAGPVAPDRPTFSQLWTNSVRVTAPLLPERATSMVLQAKLSDAPVGAYVQIADGLAGGDYTDVTNLSVGTGYSFRYVAVGPGGTTEGIEARVTTLVSVVTWEAGSPIECAGIRFPYNGAPIAAGTEGKLESFLATDFDYRVETVGGLIKRTKFSDTCTYTWSASAGSFKDGVNTGRSATWIAPTTPGAYTITLIVDDQGGFNKALGEGGSRNDDPHGYNDDPLQFSVTVNVQ